LGYTKQMLEAILRKSRQVAADPVLRRWLLAAALGRTSRPAPFQPHRPPYLDAVAPADRPSWDGRRMVPEPPTTPLALALPGTSVVADPASPGAVFDQPFADGEAASALHRFAWVPLMGEAAPPAWVAALWRHWCDAHLDSTDATAWEAYSAAERAANLLDFARRHGMPDGAEHALAAHAPRILATLEYGGEHHTHNHLANNGRGLFRLGCDLAMPAWAALGARILLAEAERLFLPSGVLREESSHYHLLYLRNYADCWAAAHRAGRPEEEALAAIVRRLAAVVPHFALPARLPLMGDISPDSPPEFLAGLMPGGSGGWTALLPEADALAALLTVPAVAGEALAVDGWLRRDVGPWAGLWHASPIGWSFCPGHGHQDLGGFELHYGSVAVFVDPGRGAYGEEGEAALYRSADVHNGLQLDGADPFPPNKPYYADSFRKTMAPEGAVLSSEPDGVHLRFGLPGGRRVERRWRFTTTGFTIADRAAGAGRATLTRRLVTPLPARPDGGAVLLEGEGLRLRVKADAELSVRPGKMWSAYGVASPAWFIEATGTAALPWQGTLSVEVC
jgi:hypothetical protein